MMTPPLLVDAVDLVADTAAVLNVAVIDHQTPANSVTATDAVSVSVVGRRSQTLGFPLAGAVWTLPGVGQGLADRAVSRHSRVINRPRAVEVDTARDRRWFDVLRQVDTGDRVDVRRVALSGAPVTWRCWVIGITHRIEPGRWRATLYLNTADTTF